MDAVAAAVLMFVCYFAGKGETKKNNYIFSVETKNYDFISDWIWQKSH